MALRTLQDVVAQKHEILVRLAAENIDIGRHAFDGVTMQSAIVLPDVAAKRFLEGVAIFGTHITPQGLLGFGFPTGDVNRLEGKKYLVLHAGVMMHNTEVLHAARQHEALLVSWRDQRKSFDARVTELMEGIMAIPKFHNAAKPFWNLEWKWTETHVGWGYAGLPSREFLLFLSQVADDALYGRMIVGTRAAALVEELEGFCAFRDTLVAFRKEMDHKGIPRVRGDVLSLSTPAASGLASLSVPTASEDLWACIPNQVLIAIVAMQAGTVDTVHIGGGELQGMHFVMRFPWTPFLTEMRERVRASDELCAAWEECAPSSGSTGDAARWSNATKPLRAAVVRDHAQQYIAEQVLGFHFWIPQGLPVGVLSPVISRSCLEANRPLLRDEEWTVMHFPVDDVLFRVNDDIGGLKSSVFPDETSPGFDPGDEVYSTEAAVSVRDA